MFLLPRRLSSRALLLEYFLFFSARAGATASIITVQEAQGLLPLYPNAIETELDYTKSIAIVGAGSAGLAALKTLLDLPYETRKGWEIVALEQRRDVGGVWLDDPNEPQPPHLPETPLYPDLHTNTPHPMMTFPNTPFPPMTPLWPNWTYVYRYHRDFAENNGLLPYIRFNTSVYEADWVGNSSSGRWNITLHHKTNGIVAETHETFDHLIVASGHNHYPFIPEFEGQEAWLHNSPPGTKREILHSVFWRHPEDYKGKSVVVLGGGGSGRDMAFRSGLYAEKLYLSLKPNKTVFDAIPPYIIVKPAVSHFTASSIVFEDGSALQDVDTVLLGTGYELRVPFLSAGQALDIIPRSASSANASNTDSVHSENARGPLTTNLRYIYPLHRHIFSLCTQYPTNVLAFIGLPSAIANCPSDVAQSLLVAHAIANASLLPPRDEMLQQLADEEAWLLSHGFDPYRQGHSLVNLVPNTSRAQDYQDDIVDYLRSRGAIPDDGIPFVEEWRRWLFANIFILRRGWARVEAAGDAAVRRWLEGAETEDQWYGMMRRLFKWELEKEQEEGGGSLNNIMFGGFGGSLWENEFW